MREVGERKVARNRKRIENGKDICIDLREKYTVEGKR